MVLDLHLGSFEALESFIQNCTFKEMKIVHNSRLGQNNRLTSSETVNPFTVVTLKVMECQAVCMPMCRVSCQKVEQDKQGRVSCIASPRKFMSSKNVLLGLSVFRYGSKRSMHGRPSWEFALYVRESEQTKQRPDIILTLTDGLKWLACYAGYKW